MSARDRALAEARAWLGTPYRHRTSARGIGADCLGLIRGIWRSLYGAEPEPMPVYRPDWAEVGGRETLIEAARRRLVELSWDEARPGDVLVFRMAPGAPAKHCALLSGPGLMIHAYWGRAVVESRLGDWWQQRRAAAFTWPEPPGTDEEAT